MAHAHADVLHLRECHECGLFQEMPALNDGDAAHCLRCHGTLRHARANSRLETIFCAGTAAILFALAIALPFISLHAFGKLATSTLSTGPEMFRERGVDSLALVVLLTLFVIPALKLTITLATLMASYAPNVPRWIPYLFGWLHRISPWSMVEVFVLGAFVAYTRLGAFANVEVGPACFALGGMVLAMATADFVLDDTAIWHHLETNAIERHYAEPTEGDLISCHACQRVSRQPEGESCARCSHTLHRRKTNSTARVTALLITGSLLYIPANAFPVMTVMRLGHGGPHTIIGGVLELFEAHMWPLAVLVLVASILVPILKLAAMVIMLVMTHRKSSAFLHERTRLARLVHWIGRWSMIDIFMLTVLVAVVQLGAVSTVLPGGGAIAFCAVVIFTMLATQCFDPRLMWDAAGANSQASTSPPSSP